MRTHSRVCLLSNDTGAEVRAVAARINAQVVRDGVSLEKALAESRAPKQKDSGLLRSLSSGVLRWHHRVQWQAGELLSRPLERRDAELAALLRLGLFQLQWLRVPDHAAVSATVAAANLVGAGRARGLVNAVLRRFLRERDEIGDRMAAVPSALFSHPDWLLERLRREWPNDWRAVIDASNELPPMWLRVNRRKGSRDDYLAMLAAEGIEASAVDEDSAIELSEPRPAATLPGYADGRVAVQDGAGQLAVSYLDLRPGQRVLDACAAPGGKSAHIIESCPSVQELIALDRDADRLATLQTALDRLGHDVSVRVGDAGEPGDWWDGRAFDRILLDAPCSALGVIRRHPDIKVLRRPEDLDTSVVSQRRLMRALWPLLAPGGRMLYAVCTLTAAETVEQVENFLEHTPDAVLTGPAASRGLQILPGEANRDGFYYACIDKKE